MSRRSRPARYGIALGSTGIALAVHAMLSSVIGADHYPFTTLFAAIALASWYGGAGPACVALLAGAFGAQWLFVSPRIGALPSTADDWLGLATVALSGGVVIALGKATERERMLLKRTLQHERVADIGAMTVRVAHDFGNPLAALHMATQRLRRLLTREPVRADRLAAVIDTMIDTTKRLDVLIGEFKEIAREQRLQLRDVMLPALLRQVVAAWQPEAKDRDIALESGVFGPLPTLRADEDQLRRVLDHLVKNALEAVEHGPGAVRVAAESRGADHVRIIVEDTGPGVPHGTDVFAMFETTKPTGTGLGLPICKQIAQAHGGGIECGPRFPRGAVFTVELPTHGPVTLQL